MADIYDDEELRDEDDFPDDVKLTQVGDRIRARVTRVDKIRTRFGPTLKYWLFDGQKEVTMLAGKKNLKGQLLSLRPRPGDVLDIELIEKRQTSGGELHVFDVQCEPGSMPAPPPPPPRAEAAPGMDPPPDRPPVVQRASVPAARDDDDSSIFDL